MKCWEVLKFFNEFGQAVGKKEMACDDWLGLLRYLHEVWSGESHLPG